MMNFIQCLWLARRKKKWNVAGTVRYCSIFTITSSMQYESSWKTYWR